MTAIMSRSQAELQGIPSPRRTTAATFSVLMRRTLAGWADDYVPSMGAALAYSTLFSLAPLLLVVVAVAGLVFGEEAARGEVVSQLSGLMGQDGAMAVEALLKGVSRPAGSEIGRASCRERV